MKTLFLLSLFALQGLSQSDNKNDVKKEQEEPKIVRMAAKPQGSPEEFIRNKQIQMGKSKLSEFQSKSKPKSNK